MSKAKNYSEKNFEQFKQDLNEKFENKFPMDFNEIYKEFFEMQDQILPKFCESVNDTLNAKQLSDYIIKLYNRMRDELENIFDTNRGFYDEWFNMEYDDLLKNLSNMEITRVEDSKLFLFNFSNEMQNGISKFLNIPNSEFCKGLIEIILKILNENLFDKLKLIGQQISDLHLNNNRENNQTIDSLNNTIKRLTDALNSEKRINEEKNKEKSELYVTKIELESKYEKLFRDTKSKEREFSNNLAIESQKFQKMESYYLNLIKEKDGNVSNLESKVDKLNKEINDLNKEISSKTIELNKENTKLSVELERIRGQDKKTKTDVFDNKSVNLQALFKTIQNIFMEFKDSVDKLDREKENVFKTKYLELSTKEIEGKSKNWIEEIRLFREDQIRAISENYEKSLSKAKDELEEANFNLTQISFQLNEEIQLKDTFKAKFEDAKKETQDYKSISEHKDSIISTQREVIIFIIKIKIPYLFILNQILFYSISIIFSIFINLFMIY